MTLFTKTKLGIIIFLLIPYFSFTQNEPFWTEDFSNHTGINLPQNWITTDASNNTAEILWRRCGIPENCPPDTLSNTFIQDNFRSSTVDNGYAFAYSAENTNLSENHLSQLTSPVIDLPNLTNELYLEFQSFLITINIREHEGTKLQIQEDGGDWIEHEIYPDVPNYPQLNPQKTNNANVFFIDLSQYADAENIRLRWEWSGNEEIIWCLDDCKLFDYNPLDIRKIWDFGNFTGGLNGWEINNNSPEDCSWEWEPIGYYGDAFLPIGNNNKCINSPTFQTGAVVVNGDFCFTSDAPPTMDPSSFPAFRSELISPVIDLSNTTDQVLLDFYQLIRKVENAPPATPSPFLFAYSIDNGASWSADEQLNVSFASNLTYNTHETLLLSADLIGQSEVRLKFTFEGKLFYWGLDDIRILERAANDMRISKEFYAIPANYSTPVSQLDSIVFLADIENFGTEVQSNIWLQIEIKNVDTELSVHKDSIFIQAATPLQLIENQLFNKAFMPPPIAAHYRGTYSVKSSNIDDVPSNDAISFDFEVTEKSFAKESQTSFGFTPNARDFSWGNAFYITNGDGYYADSVFFTIENLEDMDGYDVQLELYEWEFNADDTLKATPNEYMRIGVNIVEISEDMSDLTGIPVDISGERIPLKDNTQYFVVLRYDHPLGTTQRCFLATSQEADYNAMNFASILRNDKRYATLSKDASTEDFDVIGIGNGSGFDFVPQIRLSIADSPTSIAEIELKQEELKIYPNPTQTNFTIDLSNESKGNILIYNSLGSLVRHVNDFSNEKIISIQDLPNGTYFVHFIEEKTENIKRGILVKM